MRFLKLVFKNQALTSLTDLTPEFKAVGAISTAFNTARRLYALPITYPTTTGAYGPITGGEIYEEK